MQVQKPLFFPLSNAALQISSPKKTLYIHKKRGAEKVKNMRILKIEKKRKKKKMKKNR